MTTLTRRPFTDGPQGWQIYYGDVRVGSIRMAAGLPTHADQWTWSLGFQPGMTNVVGGTAATFEEARAAFKAGWKLVHPKLTKEQFEAWRRDRDWTAWKYGMWAEHRLMPSQSQDGRSTCFCGARIPVACEQHVYVAHRGIGRV